MSTRIWFPTGPMNSNFAEASFGSPPRRIGAPTCKQCSIDMKYEWLPQPLLFEWEPGSDVIGDFVWPTSVRPVCRYSVVEELAREFRGIEPGPIEMYQDPKIKQPKRITRRTKPRVWLPYRGPELVELWAPGRVPCSPRTTMYIHKTCPVCGREARGLSGVESRYHRWDKEKHALVPVREPRIPGQGLFIEREALGDLALFRVEQFPLVLLCTDEFKCFVEEKGYTNIEFWEYGDLT